MVILGLVVRLCDEGMVVGGVLGVGVLLGMILYGLVVFGVFVWKLLYLFSDSIIVVIKVFVCN